MAAVPMGILAPTASAAPLQTPPGVQVPKGQLKPLNPNLGPKTQPVKPAKPEKIISPVKPGWGPAPKKLQPGAFKPKPKPLTPLQQFLTNMGSSDLASKL